MEVCHLAAEKRLRLILADHFGCPCVQCCPSFETDEQKNLDLPFIIGASVTYQEETVGGAVMKQVRNHDMMTGLPPDAAVEC